MKSESQLILLDVLLHSALATTDINQCSQSTRVESVYKDVECWLLWYSHRVVFSPRPFLKQRLFGS